MTVTTVSSAAGSSSAGTTASSQTMLGQADFLRMLTVQLQQQDPTNPVDNNEMLAQMAQFSTLAGVTETNEVLQEISEKLDLLTAAAEAGSDE